MRFFAAVLASALSLQGNLGEVQVLPFGQFKARDGRPGPGKSWNVDNRSGASLAAALNAVAAQTPIVIDYEHQTLLTAQNGQPAPAAGWMKSFEWRDGKGLWATVEWTAAAKALIESKQYQYFSPVITYDESGNVTGVQLGALVNHPGLLGMEAAVAQLSTLLNPNEPESHDMDLLAALAALFAMAANTTPEQMVAFLTALKAQMDQLPKLAEKLELDAKADLAAMIAKVEALKTAALKGAGSDPATLAAMTALQSQVAALTAQINQRDVTELIDGAIKEHKLLPAQRDWAINLAKTDLAALKAFIATAQPMQGLGGQPAGGGGGDDATALSGMEATVAAQFGLTLEQYKAAAPKTH